MASSRLLTVCLCSLVLLLVIAQSPVDASVHIGSCVWGATDYFSDCRKECKNRGYKSGHCGSFWNVNCWCD
ncbi:unnamed protein product [Leptosia nina]|uniref:Defensin n=1 Tax=Leptosia nina TaxID=320188 RepID=A0AAV1JSP9_9NEOP